MHLLILGRSSIVSRRVLPAARACTPIDAISVASRRDGGGAPIDGVRLFGDYDEALTSSGADVVYVSGVNAEHKDWVMHALDRGLHVIVDKPAFLDLESAEAAVARAHQVGRGLAEATVFGFHPQMATFCSLVPADTRSSTRATICFSIPPRPPGDFRTRRDCGGGCLYDLGPYVAATNRLLFDRAPERVECQVLSAIGSPAVDSSFSFLLTHENGGALAGHCGFVTAYQNRLSSLSQARAIDAERIFATPPDFACTLRVREDDLDRTIPIPPADSFALFLQNFCGAVERHDYTSFESALMEDARLLARLRRAAEAN